MKKSVEMKRVLALMLGCTTVLGMIGCGGVPGSESSGENPNDTRKKLVVGVYDGAVGYAWAQELEKMYEAINPDINVVITWQKAPYDDGMLIKNKAIEINDEDVYFLSSNNITPAIEGNMIEDITDIVTEKIYDNDGNLVESGATKSIEDIMWPAWRAGYKTGDKYYVLPNFTPAVGINYDADLFTEKGYNVPKTYTELKTLMNRMVSDGVTPFTFSQMHEYIIGTAATAMYAQYEGLSNFMLQSTFSGTHSVLGEITLENGYKLQEAGGKYAAVQFMRDLAVNSQYTTEGARNGLTHRGAQSEFVANGFGFDTKNRVAMLLENCFWEREAKPDIDALGDINPVEWGWGKRNFQFMPMPVDNKLTDRTTILCSYSASYVVLSSNSDMKAEAKEFLKFAHSREALATYLIHSGTTRPFSFKMTPAEKAQCTPYTLSVYDWVYENPNVDLVHTNIKNNPVASVIPDFDSYWFDGIAKIQSPYEYFKGSPNATLQSYIESAKSWASGSYTTWYNTAMGK